ncbi:hypothetical protein [Lewinella sp. IMCC34191]|uniref:hypothetical protein n=1 Tax=Lewinella sp. IMCC34191 TaxID=2259172 RepID=UPI000E26E123|nr:hypothetical protein [Lewinella sp. IMCC34191]
MPKMLFTVLWLLLFCFPLEVVYGQVVRDSTPSNLAGNYIFLSPLKVLDGSNPGILYGAGKIWPSGFGAEIGHLYLISTPEQREPISDLLGDRLHLGIRKYLVRQAERLSPYVGLRLDHLRRNHRAVVPIDGRNNAQVVEATYLDSVRVESRITTLNVVAGMDSRNGRISADLLIGLGIRWRRVNHLDRIRPGDRYDYEGYAEDFIDFNQPARETAFSIPFDVRMIYRW